MENQKSVIEVNIATLLGEAEEHLKRTEYAEAGNSAKRALNALAADEGHETSVADKAHALFIIGAALEGVGSYQDSLEQCSNALFLAESASNLALQSRILCEIALVRSLQGDSTTGLTTAAKALNLAEMADNKELEARCYITMGNACINLADYTTSLKYNEHALAIYAEFKNERGRMIALNNIGSDYHYLGNYVLSLQHQSQAVTIAEEIGASVDLARFRCNIATIYKVLGDYTRAIEIYDSALAGAKEAANPRVIGLILSNLGCFYSEMGDFHRSLGYHFQSLALHEKTFEKTAIPTDLNGIGVTYFNLREFPKALEYAERGLNTSQQIGDLRGVRVALSTKAGILYELGDLEGAYYGYLASLKHGREILNTQEDVALDLFNLACILERQGEFEEAIVRCEEALELATELCDKFVIVAARKQMAVLFEKKGDIVKAHQHLKQFLELEKELNSEESKKKVEAFNLRVAIADKERDAELARLRAEQSEAALRLKERDLANTASSLAAQTELLGNFRADLRKIVLRPDRYEPEDIIRQVKAKLKELPCEMIDFSKFEGQFATVHPEFRARLETTYPELTPQEVKMCMLIHVNLQSAAIARLMCLSERSVEGHRLNIRKKFGLTKEQTLAEALRKIDGGGEKMKDER